MVMLGSSSTTRIVRERRCCSPGLAIWLALSAGQRSRGLRASTAAPAAPDAGRRAATTSEKVDPLPSSLSSSTRAAVGAHDVLDDGEAEARALLLPGEPIVDAVELLEDALVLGARDAAAVVLDRDAHAAVGSPRRSRRCAAARRRICRRWRGG